MLIQESVNTVFQLGFVLALSLIAWLIFARKRSSFRSWVGLILPTGRSMVLTAGLFILWSGVSAAAFLVPEFTALASQDGTVAGKIGDAGFGPTAIALILMMAIFKTALSEEILFRGLIGKRLIHACGFWTGNTIQAAIFGAIHLLIFAVPGGPAFAPVLGALFFFLPGGAGWLMGFANEKLGNGSIVPGWFMHAAGNTISYPILAFVL